MKARSVPLADVLEVVRNGKSVRQQAGLGGLPITRIETISQGVVDGSRVGYAGLQMSGNEGWLLKYGDILFSHINSPSRVGNSALYSGKPRDLLHGMNLLVLRCKPDVLLPEFLIHQLRSQKFRAELGRFVNPSVNQASVSIQNLKRIQILLPSLSEQRRIADILDRADELRVKRRAAIEKLDSLTQSIFIDMFGDPITNPMGWPTSRLGDLGVIQIGPFGSLLHATDYVEEGIPLVNPKDIQSGKIRVDLSKRVTHEKAATIASYRLRPGDVLLGRRGEMGRCAVVPDEGEGWICGTGSLFIRLRSGNLMPDYLQATLSSPSFVSYLEGVSLGVTMPNLNESIVERLRLPVTPPARQAEFNHALRAVELQFEESHQSEHELDGLFGSLQDRAFRGGL